LTGGFDRPAENQQRMDNFHINGCMDWKSVAHGRDGEQLLVTGVELHLSERAHALDVEEESCLNGQLRFTDNNSMSRLGLPWDVTRDLNDSARKADNEMGNDN